MASGHFKSRIGHYVTTSAVGETVRAYVPRPLPPTPPVDLTGLSGLVSEAMLALGLLDGVRAIAPDTSLFLYMYVRKEALLSSQIEGTQSSLSDLLLFENDEAPGAPVDDVEEVSTYVAALNHGLARMRDGFPLSARLMRVGFVGELGWEVHVPAHHGEALWQRLLADGRALGVAPVGIEAQRLLRLEKGHIIIGQDTDGVTNIFEADMAWAIARKKPYYVGKRTLDILERRGIERKLVGFTLKNPADPAPEESHLVIRDGAIAGRTTSVGRSHALNKCL